jgi:hypothetical protein
MSNNGNTLNDTKQIQTYLPSLVKVLSDIIMSHVPFTFLHLIYNFKNNKCVDINLPYITSFKDFNILVTNEDYVLFLEILSLLDSNSVINVLDMLMNRLDPNTIIDSDIVGLLPANKTFVFISFIIKKLIEGLLKLAIVCDPLIKTISDSFISAKNWKMIDILSFENEMKDLNNINNINNINNTKDIAINNCLKTYLLQSENIITVTIDPVTKLTTQKFITSDYVKTTLHIFRHNNTTLNTVIKVANTMFTDFSGYSTIRNEIENRIEDIIISTACDMAISKGDVNRFMKNNSVINGIVSTLNTPYRPIFSRYIKQFPQKH